MGGRRATAAESSDVDMRWDGREPYAQPTLTLQNGRGPLWVIAQLRHVCPQCAALCAWLLEEYDARVEKADQVW